MTAGVSLAVDAAEAITIVLTVMPLIRTPMPVMLTLIPPIVT